ncbi:glycosyl hydrolase family 61-domain-containing protein [Apodospora peruviana]|uniref:lytic cellulose monooxygenase (C4-dehydrogenating) n=1 Tax=Apodospora peruviana TaxID=516989 RepID=A0AAE0M7T8_9PEZI|nr:glycosyl hydrolase family 61-domain-containing protein [Apodospora peruviana]
MPSIFPLHVLAPYVFLAATSFSASVLAHSHINYILINDLLYRGFDPTGRFPNPSNPIGWSTSADDDGFVPPSNYSTHDIICHRDGSPSKAHAPVKAGDKIHVQWNGWPASHRGPVMSYLAPCANLNTTDGCGSVDKTQLLWTKIDNSSPVLISEVGGPPGNWATDVLIASNNSWLVGIPADLEPGPYVLRHEIIALHYASKKDGAQNYPQCLNLWVEGTEKEKRAPPAVATKVVSIAPGAGTPATRLYKSTDPGVKIDIYSTLSTYVIPGPTVVSWATPVPLGRQEKLSMSTAEGTPVLVSGTRTVPFPAKATVEL